MAPLSVGPGARDLRDRDSRAPTGDARGHSICTELTLAARTGAGGAVGAVGGLRTLCCCSRAGPRWLCWRAAGDAPAHASGASPGWAGLPLHAPSSCPGSRASLALGWLPSAPSSYERWLTVGLSLSLAAAVGLAVAVLALAREVGVLRLGMAGRGALEIPQEGPPVGSAQAWAQAIHAGPRALLRIAIFTSEGCPLCRQLDPAVEHVAADPLLAVRSFRRGRRVCGLASGATCPGSPYAVALSLDGLGPVEGHVQQPRPAREHPRHRPSARAGAAVAA